MNVNGTLSQMAEAISGVPQGSVIDPTAFVAYINDINVTYNHLSADSLIHADEVKLIAPRNRHYILPNALNVSSSCLKD